MYFSCVLCWAVITAGGGHVTPGWCPRCELLTPCVTFGDNELKWFLFGQTMELVDHACQESWHLTTWESWYNWKKYLYPTFQVYVEGHWCGRCTKAAMPNTEALYLHDPVLWAPRHNWPPHCKTRNLRRANELAARAGHRRLPLEFGLQ